MSETVFTVGKRVTIKPVPKAPAAAALILFTVTLTGSVILLFVEDMEWLGVLLLIVFGAPLALWSVYCVYQFTDRRRNNANRNPAIGLTDGGVMVLFHSGGSKDYLNGKIIAVTCQNHIVRKYTGGSIQVWKANYGKVFFTLQSPDGRLYKKSVKYVYECENAANEIRKLLK